MALNPRVVNACKIRAYTDIDRLKHKMTAAIDRLLPDDVVYSEATLSEDYREDVKAAVPAARIVIEAVKVQMQIGNWTSYQPDEAATSAAQQGEVMVLLRRFMREASAEVRAEMLSLIAGEMSDGEPDTAHEIGLH
jgi:hypothetical protein